MRHFTPENILLIGSAMLLGSIILSRAGSRFGIPSLLLFLCVGMFMGSDGIGYHFESADVTQFIGMMALSVILFSGGMDTKISQIRPVAVQGIVLATVGVALTALFTGGFIYSVCGLFGYNMGFAESMLLAAVMSSTDSASVFALLRSKGLNLKENLRPTLELESGSNDPMAYVLTIILINFIKADADLLSAFETFVLQLIVGAAAGFLLGKLTLKFVNKIRLDNPSIYSVLLVGCVFLIYSLTDRLWGNGYLAVYIAGLVVGASPMTRKRETARFFDGFAWLWQIVIFLTLGLLVNPKELFDVAGLGLSVAVFMMLIGRPLSVFASLAPFRNFSLKARLYISWVGLRGAVPIIFATYPLTEGVPFAKEMFNVVFFITILSLIFQGMTVGSSAKFLKVSNDEPDGESNFGVELPEDIRAAFSEIYADDNLLKNGETLAQLKLPKHTLVMLIRRKDSYFIPRGDSQIKPGDKLLVLSEDDSALDDVCNRLGISRLSLGKNS